MHQPVSGRERKMKEQTIQKIILAYQAAVGQPCQYQDAADPLREVPCALCRLLRRTPAGISACADRQLAACERAGGEGGFSVLACHAGLVEWVVPIRESGHLLGFFHAGFAASGGKEKILAQKRSFLDRFSLPEAEFLKALEETPVIDSGRYSHYGAVLYALTQIFSESPSQGESVSAPDVRDIVYFFDEEQAKEHPTVQPLSSYIYSADLDREQMTALWQNIEMRAAAVFTELMSGRGVAAKALFDDILSFAYEEQDLTTAKISAEMLFHIIFLKYYGKDVYDVRFYRLAFETIRRLFEAKSMDGVRAVMNASFEEMYGYYNTGNAERSGLRAVQEIMDYLEKNYAEDIRVADAAAAAYLSPEYASRLFKKETSFTIKWCLNQIRMRHAQELLTQTRLPVAQISRMVGYHDTRGFYKMFAKHFGMTCSEMRSRFSGVKNGG